MTFTLIGVVTLAVGAAAIVVAVFVVRYFQQCTRAVVQGERFLAHLNELSPQVDRILAETELALADIRIITHKVDGIASQVDAVTRKTASFAMPALEGASWGLSRFKYLSAAVLGAKIVRNFWKKRKEKHTDGTADSVRDEEDA